jgi:uncharacterized OB-fold protein
VSSAVEVPSVPAPTEVSEPFWSATRQHRLTLQWCTDCDRGIHYPRTHCPSCHGSRLGWREVSGRGTLYSFARHHDGTGGGPIVALVDLDDGVRLVTALIENTSPAVGQRLEVAWQDLPDGRALPVFRPLEPVRRVGDHDVQLDRTTTFDAPQGGSR